MKIIIVGAGRTGVSLVESLAKKHYELCIIDKSRELVESITDRYNVDGVVGSGASKETLLKAGADTADILIALTPVDEINLLSCVQAKVVGTAKTVARVFQPDFTKARRSLEAEHHIDHIFNPKYDMAEVASLSIGFPGIVKLEGTFGDYLQMISVDIVDDSPIAGKTLYEIRKALDINVLIGVVIRNGKLIIPNGSFRIEAGDKIGMAAGKGAMLSSLRKIGVVKKPVKKVMIVGGGVTGEYLTEMLLQKKKSVCVIETHLDRCRVLMEKFPTVNVSYGQGDLSEILEEEGLSSYDALVSLTNKDEGNLVTSMYAWSMNIPSVLTRIDSSAHLKLLHKVKLDITLSPSEISVNKLIGLIRNFEAGAAENEIERYCTVADGKAEVIQFTVGEDFKKQGTSLKDSSFKLRRNILIISIMRGEEMISPDGDSCLLKGDKVIIVSDKKNHIERLNDIFA